MFQLHERTRRLVCLAVFGLLGVAPAFVVGAWCASRHWPGVVQAEADAIGRQLGLVVKLDDFSRLRPGCASYQGVEVSDPETGKTIFRCASLEAIWGQKADPQGGYQPVLALTASEPEIDAAAIDRLWQWASRMLEVQPGRPTIDVQFAAANLSLREGDKLHALADIAAVVEALPGGAHAMADFRIAEGKGEAARIRIVRDRRTSPPIHGFELSTGGGDLPCGFLAGKIAELQSLGTECRFRGRMWARENTEGWEGEIAGGLANLDLRRLTDGHFNEGLTGDGDATIHAARFRRGRLESISGTLTAGPGTIDRELVAAAVKRLGLVTAESLDIRDPAPIRYGQLAVFFAIDDQGLQLRGRCDSAESGAILTDGSRRLLAEPSQSPIATVALAQMLAPTGAPLAPLSRQTEWLLRHLPTTESPPTIARQRTDTTLQ